MTTPRLALAVTLAIGLMHPANAQAQGASQTAATPQFDVASVKIPAEQGAFSTRFKRSGGRIVWTTQLAYLLGYAYNMESWRISGEQVSFGAIYSIEAVTDPQATDDRLRAMFQALLIDRFKMVMHRVTKEAEGYALTVAKTGSKLQEAKDGEVPVLPEWMRRPSDDPAKLEGLVVATLPARGAGAITGRRVTMPQFTQKLQQLLSTIVLDQTGLTGKYYFALRYSTGDDPEVPFQSLVSSMKDLGLRLDTYKGPVEMLVVDHIEKVPTGN